MREELHILPPNILCRRCRRLGMDASLAIEKSDLANMIHNRYRESANTGSRFDVAYGRDLYSLMMETLGDCRVYRRHTARRIRFHHT